MPQRTQRKSALTILEVRKVETSWSLLGRIRAAQSYQR